MFLHHFLAICLHFAFRLTPAMFLHHFLAICLHFAFRLTPDYFLVMCNYLIQVRAVPIRRIWHFISKFRPINSVRQTHTQRVYVVLDLRIAFQETFHIQMLVWYLVCLFYLLRCNGYSLGLAAFTATSLACFR